MKVIVRLAITGDRNTGTKHDYTGAFKPEAARFVAASNDNRSKVVAVDLSLSRQEQRAAVAKAIHAVQPEEIGFFCHGLMRKLQIGYDLVTVGYLAADLSSVGCSRVGLYACSAGGGPGVGGDGGFADKLRDQLDSPSARVVGHVTAGHASSNPRVRFFEGAEGVGGIDVVPHGSAHWRRWCQRLREPDDTLRWDMLRMPIADIHAALG